MTAPDQSCAGRPCPLFSIAAGQHLRRNVCFACQEQSSDASRPEDRLWPGVPAAGLLTGKNPDALRAGARWDRLWPAAVVRSLHRKRSVEKLAYSERQLCGSTHGRQPPTRKRHSNAVCNGLLQAHSGLPSCAVQQAEIDTKPSLNERL